MLKITRQEVIKLAELSRIDLKEEEIELATKQLQDVLAYAERVKKIAENVEVDFVKNINIFAQDIVDKTNSEPILKQAPDREDNFFVVPRILEDK